MNSTPTPIPAAVATDTTAQRILLVTGLSGAGKSTVLNVLEDLGWETIDNFPIRLLKGLLAEPDQQKAPLAVGFDSRTRGLVPQDVQDLIRDLSSRDDVSLSTMFMDCASGELERRYNETRRRHPMAQDRPLHEGIRAERELLAPLRNQSDIVIDTSEFSSNQLQQHIRQLFSQDDTADLTVTISSFGFSRGMPPLADLVFDMRFLDNPHWVDELREQTGLDHAVGEHIRQDPAFPSAFDRIRDLLLALLPRYAAQGKSYVHIAFGCTGGRHRSVFTADQMAQSLRDAGFSLTVLHRNLGSRVTDEIEGMER